MDPLQAGDKILMSYRSEWNEQRILLTQTYVVTVPGSGTEGGAQLQELADSFASTADGTLAALYVLCLGSDVTVEEARVQKIAPLRSRYYGSSMGVTNAGDTANTGNVACVGTLVTDFAGRDQVANKHVGPIKFSSFTNGEIDNTLTTALNNFMNKLNQPVTTLATGITILPVILHRATGLVNFTSGFRLSNRVGTMRRRTVRVGE